jgi:DNA-binding CsgD family transcriptional regulator
MPHPPIRHRSQLPLTQRQQQVLTVLKTPDITRKQAAHELGISLQTLNAHLSGALARLNASSLHQALSLTS